MNHDWIVVAAGTLAVIGLCCLWAALILMVIRSYVAS